MHYIDYNDLKDSLIYGNPIIIQGKDRADIVLKKGDKVFIDSYGYDSDIWNEDCTLRFTVEDMLDVCNEFFKSFDFNHWWEEITECCDFFKVYSVYDLADCCVE